MKTLHDPSHRGELVRRLEALTPDSERRWGKMSVDQMLWHVGDALALSLGEITVSTEKPPIPRGLLKFIVLNLPWGKNAGRRIRRSWQSVTTISPLSGGVACSS